MLGDVVSVVRCTADVVILCLLGLVADLTDRSDDRARKGISIRLRSFSEAADIVAKRGAVSRSAERVSSCSFILDDCPGSSKKVPRPLKPDIRAISSKEAFE